MTSFDKQWEAAAKLARLRGEFYANFVLRHPDVKIVLIHDSALFESRDDYLLFEDELKVFLKERKRNG